MINSHAMPHGSARTGMNGEVAFCLNLIQIGLINQTAEKAFMGLAINQTHFTRQEHQQFRRKLNENLCTLEHILRDPNFGQLPPSFGAELEMYLVDNKGHAASLNDKILEAAAHPQLQMELNRYNLEYNLNPVDAKGEPFSQIFLEIQQALNRVQVLADQWQSRIVPIGILPTLREQDLTSEAISDSARYKALSNSLIHLRQQEFTVEIHGEEDLSLSCEDVTLEGANTSFQFHWLVTPQNFVDTYNAAQMVMPLVVALAANSPLLMGRVLWDETRIALFKQSIDYRSDAAQQWRLPSRVPFGFGWLRRSAFELFAEAAALFPPLLPVIGDENCQEIWCQGVMPKLEELRLHHGTVWPWNRAIFDPAEGGHLRIELRALPAGPTPQDMVANGAFFVGLAQGLSKQMDQLIPSMPYKYAEYNFYRAAQFGLDAQLVWPDVKQGLPAERTVVELLQQLFPLAGEGLNELGVADKEIKQWLSIIENRIKATASGARWQKRMWKRLIQEMTVVEAETALLEHYIKQYQNGLPVSEWSETI